MAVRIRLKRLGRVHAPVYRIVVVDGKKRRDGRVIEEVGFYDPKPNPSVIKIESPRIQYWLGVGAKPSDPVKKLLVLSGDIARFHGKSDVVSRIKLADGIDPNSIEETVEKISTEAERLKAEYSRVKVEEKTEVVDGETSTEATNEGSLADDSKE